jgi:LPXTG-site transpeptidase (sortase) family protein
MNRRQLGLSLVALQIALLMLALVGPVTKVEAASYFSWPFLQVWERTDYPVALGAAQRSWYWGPATFAVLNEKYNNSPGGYRQVAYHDKSRMEISNPGGDRGSKWYMTNGLLVRELVSGQLQLGDNDFQPLAPAEIPVSGDGPAENPGSPTYASFRNLLTPTQPHGNAFTAKLNRDGTVEEDASLAQRYPETRPAYFDSNLNHNIPGVMWDFMNLQGPVIVDRKLVTQKIEDWVFSFGLPISEPYWTRSKVAGVEKDVLVQLFERRVLTYTPSNDPAFRVEMGNVGQHYFNWRYAQNNPKPGDAQPFTQPAMRLSIPAIGVDSVIEYVGLKDDGTMDVPLNPRNVGWLRTGSRVGDRGNSVIAGHLDWYGIGPVVFWNLGKLKPGDMVYIYTSLNTKLSFRVTDTAVYPLNDYPRERVFGNNNQANLNLITCSGSFDRSSASYDKRLVVFTTLVE